MSAPARRWRFHTDGNPHRHVWPDADTVEHDTTDDTGSCVCGPTITPVERPDGTYGWILMHHSLDGREANERKV